MIRQLDTAGDDVPGQGKWELGCAAIALKMEGAWVDGGLINNVRSVGGDDNRADVSQILIQPFVNYNFPQHPGRYLTFSPTITPNWEADSSNTWTLPLGPGIDQNLKAGKLPVKVQASACSNVEKPDVTGAHRQLRLQVALLMPN